MVVADVLIAPSAQVRFVVTVQHVAIVMDIPAIAICKETAACVSVPMP